MKIDFLGFGEAARAFHETLSTTLPEAKFRAWDRLLPTQPDMADAMTSRGVAPIGVNDFTGSDWIISAVTADQSLAAIQSVASQIGQGQWVIDINSVSPEKKQKTAELVTEQNGHYLDMAVMAPVFPRGHATPVLIAGTQAHEIEKQLSALGFNLSNVGSEPGQATAIKMVRSLFVKGLEAITVECLLAAQASGCYDEILGSLTKSYPGLNLPDLAPYQFERTIQHGNRRAAEMRECAATIADLGLQGALPNAIADVQQAMADSGAQPDADIKDVLKRRLGSKTLG